MISTTTRFTSLKTGALRRQLRCRHGSIPVQLPWTREIWRRSARRSRPTPSPYKTFENVQLLPPVRPGSRDLHPSKRRKRRNRSAPQRHTQNHACQHVAQEMHSQNYTGNGDADSQEQERPFERGIEVTHYQRDGERRHVVAGGKRKPVRRKNLRPAMRLKLARPRPMAESFQYFKHQNPEEGGEPSRPNRPKLLRASIDQQQDP